MAATIIINQTNLEPNIPVKAAKSPPNIAPNTEVIPEKIPPNTAPMVVMIIDKTGKNSKARKMIANVRTDEDDILYIFINL